MDRVRVVRDLTEAWQTAITQREMRLVVIEGPTGIGKTSVVQALYEQWAMLQTRPAYWPATLHAAEPSGIRRPIPTMTGADGAVSRQDRAGRIYPMQVAPAEGAGLEWFWWGLTAQIGGFAALAGDPQIKAHVVAIADAIARGDRLTRDRLVLAAKTVSLLASLGGLGSLLAKMAANADTARDAVDVLRSVPDVFRSRASLLEAARSRHSGTVFSVTARQEAEAGAEKDGRVLGLATRALPMLIAVEAAQFLDPVTITLLRALARDSQCAGLMVLLVDSDQPSGDEPAVPEETLGGWLSSTERAQRLPRIQLNRLSDQELTELAIMELGTGLDPVMLARVVDHAEGLPGMLYELLDAPAVAEALRGDGEGPADLAAISKLDGVRDALAHAPPSIRRALAVASVHGMKTVREWLARPMVSTGRLASVSELSGMRGVIEDLIGSGWLWQRPGTQIVEFASPQLLQVCQEEQARELAPAMIRATRESLVSAVVAARADHTWDDLDWDVRESLLASVVEKAPDASSMDATYVELAAELFALRRATGRDAATRELLAAVTDRLSSGQAHPGVLTVVTAEALFDAGQQDKAFELLGDEFARLHRQFGDADSQTLSALHNLAAAYAAAAKAAHGRREAGPLYQEALTLYKKLLDHRVTALQAANYEELLAYRLRVLGPGYPETLRTSANLLAARKLVISTRDQYARLLADCYRYKEAIEQSQILLGEQRSALGPDHPDTLTTRHHLAYYRGEAGDLAAAARGFEELLPDRLRVQGADHPDTLTTRRGIALYRGQAGDPAAAARGFEDLLRDELRVLGPDHPDTLTTRHHLAYYRGEAGDLAAAVRGFEELLPDRLRVLGPDHPDTLTTRAGLALWRGIAGDPAAAARGFEELLPDRLRVQGPDHPDTLETRGSIPQWRGIAGDPAAAARGFEDLLRDELRVQGPDHPDTLTARRGVALWRGRAGDPAGGAAAAEELLADQLRVLGPDHPDTLISQALLALLRWEAGDRAGAVAAAEELLAAHLRVHGPHHPDTVNVWAMLAYWRGQHGDHGAVH